LSTRLATLVEGGEMNQKEGREEKGGEEYNKE